MRYLIMRLGIPEASRDLVEFLRHVFRERQIYVRSDAAMRYIVLRPFHQMAFASVVAAAVLWSGFATIVYFSKHEAVSLAHNNTNRVQLLYEARLASMQNAVDALNDRLMLDQGAFVGKVDDLRKDFMRLADRHRRLEVFFKQGWIPLKALENDTAGASDTLPKPKPKPPTGSASRPLPEQRASAAVSMYRTAAAAERPLTRANTQFGEIENAQNELLSRVTTLGERKAAALRKVHEEIGLDPKKVIAATTLPARASGGPLLPVQKGREPRDELDRRVLTAYQKFSEAEKLLHALTLMPTRLPMAKGYRLTSGFGFRRDPFKNVLAMHTGVDLMAPYGTPVKAAAAGTIIRAEHAVAYGRVVDIRHDNGITSRYAHMSAIKVEVGERVGVHHVIGRVGTSGRSTGPHLHYETRVHGKPIDPYQFLRIARDVLQKKSK